MTVYRATLRNRIVTILPIGDSLTADATLAGAWRMPLRSLLLSASISPRWLGSVAEGLVGGGGFHEGHGGATAPGTRTAFPGYTASYATDPDIVAVLLGTNDAAGAPAAFEAGLDGLLDDAGCVYALWPTVAVVIGLCPTQWSAPGVEQNVAGVATVRAAANAIVAARSAAGKTIVAARTDLALESYSDTYEGVHPNATGYAKLAARFFTAISALPGGTFK